MTKEDRKQSGSTLQPSIGTADRLTWGITSDLSMSSSRRSLEFQCSCDFFAILAISLQFTISQRRQELTRSHGGHKKHTCSIVHGAPHCVDHANYSARPYCKDCALQITMQLYKSVPSIVFYDAKTRQKTARSCTWTSGAPKQKMTTCMRKPMQTQRHDRPQRLNAKTIPACRWM